MKIVWYPDSAAGLTHADNVKLPVKFSDAALFTTMSPEPLKDTALLTLPAVLVTPVERVPVLLFPDESAVVVPDVSSKA